MIKTVIFFATFVAISCFFQSIHAKALGLHFDIEPQSLPEWRADRVPVAVEFLELMEKISRRWNESGIDAILAFDIPVWFHTFDVTFNGRTGKMSDFVFELVPYVNIMNFRDTFETITSSSIDEVSAANRLGKPFSVALEVQDVNFNSITFWEEGPEFMKTVMLQLEDFYSAESPYYDRMVVHAYKHLVEMQSSGFPYPERNLNCSLYYWEWYTALSPEDRAANFETIKSLPFVFDRILFESERLLTEYQPLLTEIVQDAEAHGLDVELTAGMASWALRPNHDTVMNLVELAIQFLSGNVQPQISELPFTLSAPVVRPTTSAGTSSVASSVEITQSSSIAISSFVETQTTTTIVTSAASSTFAVAPTDDNRGNAGFSNTANFLFVSLTTFALVVFSGLL